MAAKSLPLFLVHTIRQGKKRPDLAICVICHVVFQRRKHKQKCCSRECNYLSRNAPPDKPIACKHCLVVFMPTRKWQAYCSTKCRNKAEWQRVGKVIKERSRDRINELQRQRIAKMSRARRILPGFNSRYKACLTLVELEDMLVQQDEKCALCGDLLDKWEIDHIVARGNGGFSTADNLQIVCRPCNVGKWTMTVDDYIAHCMKVADFQRKAREAGADIPAKPKKRGSKAGY